MKLTCNPNIVYAPPSESTLTYTQLKSIKWGSKYFPELFYIVHEVPSISEPQKKQGGDAFWAEDAFLAEDAWMAIFLFHQASATHSPTPAAWQTQSQIIHNWNIH